MNCQRFMCRTENGLAEWCDAQFSWKEIRVVIDALEYYTEKRKLDFESRMLSGDMARTIKDCEIQNLDKDE